MVSLPKRPSTASYGGHISQLSTNYHIENNPAPWDQEEEVESATYASSHFINFLDSKLKQRNLKQGTTFQEPSTSIPDIESYIQNLNKPEDSYKNLGDKVKKGSPDNQKLEKMPSERRNQPVSSKAGSHKKRSSEKYKGENSTLLLKSKEINDEDYINLEKSPKAKNDEKMLGTNEAPEAPNLERRSSKPKSPLKSRPLTSIARRQSKGLKSSDSIDSETANFFKTSKLFLKTDEGNSLENTNTPAFNINSPKEKKRRRSSQFAKSISTHHAKEDELLIEAQDEPLQPQEIIRSPERHKPNGYDFSSQENIDVEPPKKVRESKVVKHSTNHRSLGSANDIPQFGKSTFTPIVLFPEEVKKTKKTPQGMQKNKTTNNVIRKLKAIGQFDNDKNLRTKIKNPTALIQRVNIEDFLQAHNQTSYNNNINVSQIATQENTIKNSLLLRTEINTATEIEIMTPAISRTTTETQIPKEHHRVQSVQSSRAGISVTVKQSGPYGYGQEQEQSEPLDIINSIKNTHRIWNEHNDQYKNLEPPSLLSLKKDSGRDQHSFNNRVVEKIKNAEIQNSKLSKTGNMEGNSMYSTSFTNGFVSKIETNNWLTLVTPSEIKVGNNRQERSPLDKTKKYVLNKTFRVKENSIYKKSLDLIRSKVSLNVSKAVKLNTTAKQDDMDTVIETKKDIRTISTAKSLLKGVLSIPIEGLRKNNFVKTVSNNHIKKNNITWGVGDKGEISKQGIRKKYI